jgi:hypothetical protein
MSSTSTKSKMSPALMAAMDRTRDFIASNFGSANVRQILVTVFGNKNPEPDHIDAAHRTLREDERFDIVGEGAAAVVTIKGPATEPETLDPQALAAGAAAEDRQDEPAPPTEHELTTASEFPDHPNEDSAAAFHKAVAEKMETPPADQAPTIDAQPTNEIVLKACAAAILSGMAANSGEAPEALDVIGYAKEEVAAAVGNLFLGGLVEKVNDSGAILLVLTCAGWTEAMALAKKKADAELQKKNDELRALHKHIFTEKELAEEVRACEHEVEAAKQTVAACKESLAEANKKLAAFVRGDVQTSFLAEDSATAPTGEVTAYEKGMQAWDPAKAEAVNPFRDDPQRTDWQRGYDAGKKQNPKKEPAAKAGDPVFPGAPKAIHKTADEIGTDIDVLDRAMMDEPERNEIRIGTPLNVATNTVSAYEREYLVIEGAGGGPDFQYLALPLYTKDEWQQLYEARFGRCVEGIDQTEDAKTQRQIGGEFCGKVVKLGRKKAVIGPVDDALCITAIDDNATTPPAEDEPEDDEADQDDIGDGSGTGD